MIIFIGLFSTMMFLWHMCGVILGQDYDYLTRKKTYNGWKAIFWLSILVVCLL